MVAVTLAVLDGQLTKQPLTDVRVRVYSEDGTVFVTEGDTDESGEVSFLLDDLTYHWVRFFRPGWRFPTKARVFVDETNGATAFEVYGHDLVEMPTSTDVTLCRVSGIVVNPAGIPVDGAYFRFLALGYPRVLGDRPVVPTRVEVRSSQGGYVEVDLIRGGVYEVACEGMGGPYLDDFSRQVLVPDVLSAKLADVIWPYVREVSFSTNSLALVVGETAEVDITVLLSSGLETPFTIIDEVHLFGRYVRLAKSLEGIVELEYIPGTSTIRVSGASTGEVTISPTPIASVVAPRVPVPDATLGELVVTVT